MTRLFNAYLDDFNKITIIIPKHYFNGKSTAFSLIKGTEEIDLYIEQIIDLGEYMKYICLIRTFIELGLPYLIRDEYGNTVDLQSGAVVRTPHFDTLYYYENRDLGFSYSKEKTIFKLWAPTATEVSLLLKNNEVNIYPMLRKPKGVFEVVINGDIEGSTYRYMVKNNNFYKEIIDVYGVASTVNHTYSAIIDKSKLLSVSPLTNKICNPTDAIIYELSIRDFTMDKSSGVKQRGKYLGLIERNTKTESGKITGFDYLIDLGITHVQILPFFDFSGVDELDVERGYNWGYNPEQFNTPEGSFSVRPDDIYARINELRKMISVLHEHNIGVIMDVVYNHVGHIERFPFEYMVPGYFYRYDNNGMPTNGSGCGNDLATERGMVRKFIIDSVLYWAREYQIDGFRFDLMGLMDVETMNILRKELDEINPSILMYGEGWNMHTSLSEAHKSIKENAHKLPGISFFNDKYRDIIKGHTFSVKNLGFPFGDYTHLNEVKLLLSGSVGYEKQMQYLFFEPYQSVNYLECHDNLTMYDKTKVALENEAKVIRVKKQRLANSMLILSQGIPFIHSGQEFYRTKYGIENSYNSPDKINSINWKRYEENYEDTLYFKELIKVRKSHQAFRFYSAAKIRKHLRFIDSDEGIITLELHDLKQYGPFQDIRIIFNCTLQDYVCKLTSDYKLLFDEKAFLNPKTITNYLIVPMLSVIIIVK